MNTKLKKIAELKVNDIFIIDNKECIVTQIHNGLLWYVETSNRNGRAKFVSEMSLRIIEAYQ